MSKISNYLKPLIFMFGLVVLVLGIQTIFRVSDDRILQSMQGFYQEEDNSLDAVYIGASNTYTYWQAPLAWKDYGIAVYPLSVPGMPAEALENMIVEGRKTQPDALYIVTLNELKYTDVKVEKIHYMADYMPLSMNKINMVQKLSETAGISGLDQLEFYLPIIRFHSGWSELSSQSFDHTLTGLKGAISYNTFLNKSADISDGYIEVDEVVSITDEQRNILDHLLDYCEEEQVNVLFVFVPQSTYKTFDETVLAQFNDMEEIITSRGFDCLNMTRSMDEISLLTTQDFYNEFHTNLHGSIKYTYYLSQYLVDHYGFEDKRGDDSYSSWDDAWRMYSEIITPYSLDIELEHTPRDYELETPALNLKVNGQNFTLSWDQVDNAEGYWVYRKKCLDDIETPSYSAWERVAELDADKSSYQDKGLPLHAQYMYTVVPVRFENGITFCGQFNLSGVSGTSTLDAPELQSAKETEKGIVITWSEVKNADGYKVYRKINGQEGWESIATVQDATSYTDECYLQSIPYKYTVRAYQTVDGSDVYGSYQIKGILLMRDLEEPVVSVAENSDHLPVLTWNAVVGADYYNVYRKTGTNEWELIRENLTGAALEFTDTDFDGSRKCAYKVSAVLKYGKDIYEYPSNEVFFDGGN